MAGAAEEEAVVAAEAQAAAAAVEPDGSGTQAEALEAAAEDRAP